MKNTIQNNGITLSISVNGRPVNTYLHEGKYFIESRENTEYSIEVKNDNSYRVEAVISVDGLSVLTGKSASTKDVGYIISAWNKISVKGFRKDTNTVGAFKFTKKEKAYAKSKGLGHNVGVIALSVFKEKVKEEPITIYKTIYIDNTKIDHDYWQPKTPWIQPYPTWTCNAQGMDNSGQTRSVNFCSTNMDNSASGACTSYTTRICDLNSNVKLQSNITPNFEHGTSWGSKIDDKVTTVTFERDNCIWTQEIFYNSKNNLENMGIKFIQEKQVAFPKGFPSDFAVPPAGWEG